MTSRCTWIPSLALLAACGTTPAPDASVDDTTSVPVAASATPFLGNLQVSAFLPGQPITFTASGFPPNAPVYFYASLAGVGAGPCSPLTGACLDILNPTLIGRIRADGTGVAVLSLPRSPPAAPVGLTGFFQAGSPDPANSGTTQVVARLAGDADTDGQLAPADCDDNDPTRNTLDLDADGDTSCASDCNDLNDALNGLDLDADGDTTCATDCDDDDNTRSGLDLDGDGDSSCATDCDDANDGLNGLDEDFDGATSCEGDCDDNSDALNLQDVDFDGFTTCDGDCNDLDDRVFPEVETNNTISTAGPLAEGGAVCAAIDPAGDQDFFGFSLTLPSTLRFETTNGLGACGGDTLIRLFNSSGTEVGVDDDDGIGLCSLIDGTNDGFARNVPPGDWFIRVEEFANDGTIPRYDLSFAILSQCGDGLIEGAEQCDGTPDCNPANCTLLPVCGNNIVELGETCDDGAQIPGDGCDDNCQLEGVFVETEANNSAGTANALGTATLVQGAIDPTNDIDFYSLDLAAPTVYRIETFAPALNDCDASTTTLRLYNSAGTQVISDTTSGIRNCSAIAFTLPAGVSFFSVEETGLNALIAGYTVQAVAADELGTELEPNEDIATATALGTLSPGDDLWIAGDHSVGLDIDTFVFTLPVPSSVRFETLEGDRAVETCESNGIDSRLTLFNSGGTLLVDDDDDGRGFCSKIDGTGTLPVDTGARNLPAGTYAIQVRASSFATGSAAGQFTYRLLLTAR